MKSQQHLTCTCANVQKQCVQSCTLEGGLVHAGHAGAVVLSWKTVDVNFKWDRAHRRTEVKQTHLLDQRREEERFNVRSWQQEARLSAI